MYLSRNPLTAKDFAVAAGTSFRISGQPNAANGFEATDLVEICDRYLQARDPAVKRQRGYVGEVEYLAVFYGHAPW